MPSQYVRRPRAILGVLAAVVPAGQARQLEAVPPIPAVGKYVLAAHVIAKAGSTWDKAKTTTRTRPAATRVLKDFFMTTIEYKEPFSRGPGSLRARVLRTPQRVLRTLQRALQPDDQSHDCVV